MGAKFLIFVVFVFVAQSSPALASRNSCTVSTVKIRADLDTVGYGESTALMGLHRVNQLIYRLMYEVCEKTYGTRTGSKHTYSAYSLENRPTETKLGNTSFAAWMEETLAAAMIGIVPILEVVRILRPEFEIPPGQNRSESLLRSILGYFYMGIELAQSENCSKTKAQIAVYESQALRGGQALIDGFFSNLLTIYPPETQAVLACLKQSVASKIMGAFRVIFHAIKLLQTQLCSDTPAGSGDCSSAIKADEDKSADLFKAEVMQKYGIISVLVIDDYLNKTGTINGLLALKSAGVI